MPGWPAPAKSTVPHGRRDTRGLDIEGHVSIDISYLSDPERYLADLMRHRERLAATLDADVWAKTESMPSDDEIKRIRRLIDRMKGGLDKLTESLQADLATAHGQITRQATRIRQLEKKLSDLMGEQAWRESGLGAAADIDQLHRRITNLEQQVVDLRDQLNERDQELDAAGAANRERIANLNRSGVG
jgi:polyhydroxyalkanoate synthesis regulator phasin